MCRPKISKFTGLRPVRTKKTKSRKLKTSQRSGQPEAGIRASDVDPDPGPGADVPRVVVPRTAAQDAEPGTTWGCSRGGSTRRAFKGFEPCGAKTRSGCPCKGPAMTNGRCCMHGGASTGPSADGHARIAAARTNDGFYTKAMKASTEGVPMFVRRKRVVRNDVAHGVCAEGPRAGGAGTPGVRRESSGFHPPGGSGRTCLAPPPQLRRGHKIRHSSAARFADVSHGGALAGVPDGGGCVSGEGRDPAVQANYCSAQ